MSIAHSIARVYRQQKELYCIRAGQRNQLNVLHSPERISNVTAVELTPQQHRVIDEFFMENLGERIPHDWHEVYTSFTGNFDVQYFPEYIFTPRLERFMNAPEYRKVFGNKNNLHLLARAADVKTAETLFYVSNGIIRENRGDIIPKDRAIQMLSDSKEVYVKKSIDSSGGTGCYRVSFENGVEKTGGETCDHFLSKVGENYIVQSVIMQHPLLAAFENGSAATFRVITYLWKGQIYACPLTLRLGRAGTSVSNAAVIIAVDNDGLIHDVGFHKSGTRYTEHPDSRICFSGYRLVGVDKVINAAKRLHAVIPQLGIINWDFTIDEAGEPVVIEANTRMGSIWLPELVHGVGPFGDNTADILKWMRFMKTVNIDDRYYYKSGYYEKIRLE